MDNDFKRAVKWGFGIYIGIVLAAITVAVLGVLIFWIGGWALVALNSAPTATASSPPRTEPLATHTSPSQFQPPMPSPLSPAEQRQLDAEQAAFIKKRDEKRRADDEVAAKEKKKRDDAAAAVAKEKADRAQFEAAREKQKQMDAERIERDLARLQHEKDAQSALDIAKDLLKADKADKAKERLKAVADKYADTAAGKEAADMLKKLDK